MKKTVGYRIDYATSTATVTKKFLEAAGIIGTPEFEQRKILADMGLTIKVRETKPRCAATSLLLRTARSI